MKSCEGQNKFVTLQSKSVLTGFLLELFDFLVFAKDYKHSYNNA